MLIPEMCFWDFEEVRYSPREPRSPLKTSIKPSEELEGSERRKDTRNKPSKAWQGWWKVLQYPNQRRRAQKGSEQDAGEQAQTAGPLMVLKGKWTLIK